MQKTTNYQLNQWDAEDRVTREDFNADNAKIDAAIKAVADAGSGIELVFGDYLGDGATMRTVNLGFEPKFVFVEARGGAPEAGSGVTSCFATKTFPAYRQGYGGYASLVLAANGFHVSTYAPAGSNTNAENCPYNYVAIK